MEVDPSDSPEKRPTQAFDNDKRKPSTVSGLSMHGLGHMVSTAIDSDRQSSKRRN
jgi:hypothetical protein